MVVFILEVFVEESYELFLGKLLRKNLEYINNQIFLISISWQYYLFELKKEEENRREESII